jgi:hypothetical protein
MRIPVEVVNFAKEGAQPQNVNLARVTINRHPRFSAAPIELTAGCSWACLDLDGARAVVAALTHAIGTIESAKKRRCSRPDCSGWTFDANPECEDCR